MILELAKTQRSVQNEPSPLSFVRDVRCPVLAIIRVVRSYQTVVIEDKRRRQPEHRRVHRREGPEPPTTPRWSGFSAEGRLYPIVPKAFTRSHALVGVRRRQKPCAMIGRGPMR